jgi:hypothetical protein
VFSTLGSAFTRRPPLGHLRVEHQQQHVAARKLLRNLSGPAIHRRLRRSTQMQNPQKRRSPSRPEIGGEGSAELSLPPWRAEPSPVYASRSHQKLRTQRVSKCNKKVNSCALYRRSMKFYKVITLLLDFAFSPRILPARALVVFAFFSLLEDENCRTALLSNLVRVFEL